MELERGERVGAPGGGLEREGEGERVEAGSRRRARGRGRGCGVEAAGEEEEAARGLRGSRKAPEHGIEIVVGGAGERAEEVERVGQRSGVR